MLDYFQKSYQPPLNLLPCAYTKKPSTQIWQNEAIFLRLFRFSVFWLWKKHVKRWLWVLFLFPFFVQNSVHVIMFAIKQVHFIYTTSTNFQIILANLLDDTNIKCMYICTYSKVIIANMLKIFRQVNVVQFT